MRPSHGFAAMLAATLVAQVAYAQERAPSGAKPGVVNEMSGPDRLFQTLNGDRVPDAATAVDLAEVLIRHGYGEGMLKAQQPLNARDAGTYWEIDGTPEAVDPATKSGPVRVRIRKADASVAPIYFELPRGLREQLDKAERQYGDQSDAPSEPAR